MSRPKPIKNIIIELLKAYGLKDKFDQYLAIAYWESCVGKEIASHTTPIEVENGIVFVQVDSDTWRNELVFFKHEIIQRLNERIGKPVVQEIKFY